MTHPLDLFIEKDVFSASKRNRHYNVYGEKKDPDLRLYADQGLFTIQNVRSSKSRSDASNKLS